MITRNVLSLALLFPVLAASSLAAVVTDPILTTGSGAIDPAGSRTVDVQATGSASIATLISQTDFRGAVQSGWTGFVGAGTSTNNIFNFTDSTLPDISFDVSGSFGTNTGSNVGNTLRTTSSSSGYNIVASGGGSLATPLTVTVTINLGSYNSGTQMFTNGATVNGVGFTVAALLSTATTGQTATATFFNAYNTLLSTQSIIASGTLTDNDSQANSRDGYFGYVGDGSMAGGVSKIILAIQYTTGGTTGKALDDFGITSLTAIPEPSSYALLAGVAGLLLVVSKRTVDRRR